MASSPIQSIGPYQIIGILGEGGMAVVYKAVDTRLSRFVAIKMIRQEAPQDDTIFQRFEREAKTLAQLNHPNIAKILDYGMYEGLPYLVMEYMPGGTYRQKMTSPMDYRSAAHSLLPIARALNYAHRKGVIHRDIKPANILIDENGEPKLSDFGIARAVTSEQTTELTAAGLMIGTVDYMAPEQFIGSRGDQRSDIYSLGVVYFEMITGHRPFEADTPIGVITRQATESFPHPSALVPNLPTGVDQLLLKAVTKLPEQRYQSMIEFISALEALASGLLPTAAPTEARNDAARYATIMPTAVKTSAVPHPVATIIASPLVGVKPRIKSGLVISSIIGFLLLSGGVVGGIILWQLSKVVSKGTTRPPQALIQSTAVPTLAITPSPDEVAQVTLTPTLKRLPASLTPTPRVDSPTPSEPGLIFYDDFTNRGSGWTVFQDASGKADYENGGFRILIHAPQQDLWSNPHLSSLQDVRVSVEAQPISSVDNNIYGLICRFSRDMSGVNFYFFGISGLGTAAIGKTVGSQQEYLERISQPSAAINTGQASNTIMAICLGSRLRLLVNGVEVLTAEDDGLMSGDVGLLAGAFSEPGVDILFDNFSVKLP